MVGFLRVYAEEEVKWSVPLVWNGEFGRSDVTRAGFSSLIPIGRRPSRINTNGTGP
jgi:hypothetical protein